jgi:hypothetical protein
MASGHLKNPIESWDFSKTTIQRSQLQSSRFGLAFCCGIAAEKHREKEISGFLNERNSDLNSG